MIPTLWPESARVLITLASRIGKVSVIPTLWPESARVLKTLASRIGKVSVITTVSLRSDSDLRLIPGTSVDHEIN